MKIIKHIRTIHKHKWEVFKLCVKAGIPWQGITHDLSKLNPVEFIPAIKYATGESSPHHIERKRKGYSAAWLHHKGRNKHHAHYWLDDVPGGMVPMPFKYAVENICDRIGANKAYNSKDYKDSDPLHYWMNIQNTRTNDRMLIHPNTKAFIEETLSRLSTEGEKIINKKTLKEIYDKHHI